MERIGDILVLPFTGQGHINPAVELCKLLASHTKFRAILIIPSHLSSSVPSTLHKDYPSIEVLHIEESERKGPPPPPPERPAEANGARPARGRGPHHPHGPHGDQNMKQGIENFISERYKNAPGQTRPSGVVMDMMMSWSKEIFLREKIPIFSFFTTGAASTAMEFAAWKAHAHDMKPGETRPLDGLPECVKLKYSDVRRRGHRVPPHGDGKPRVDGPSWMPDFGLRDPGEAPRWLDDGKDSTALLINTCHELEGPFLDYVSSQAKRPVFGIGPLLPETYWQSIGTVIHDRESRSDRKSNYTEDEIMQWLDSKPSKSVIYIAFGSEVGPSREEYGELADALGDSKWAFVWVIQPGSGKSGPPRKHVGDEHGSDKKDEGFDPVGLEEKVGDRGLIIKGWAPQLMILSHPSTGGFVSHCGWNSTVEAIGRGHPFLAWPIRGDQYYNAKWVVEYLKIGVMISTADNSDTVKKSDIIQLIDKLMDNNEYRERAISLGSNFENGFPSTSKASITKLIELASNE